MARTSEFTFLGSIALGCKKCPAQFQFAADTVQELEDVMKRVVEHRHIDARSQSTQEQAVSAEAVRVHNVVSGSVTGPVVQIGVQEFDEDALEIRRQQARADRRRSGYLW